MIALKLQNIMVQHANMLPILNIVSFPSLMAFTGFANALAYNYGLRESSVTIISTGNDVEIGLVNKYGQRNTNNIKGINTFTSSKSKKDLPLSEQPNVLGRLSLTLYIYFDDSIAESLRKDKDSGKLLKELLTRYRIAGGVISSIGSIEILTKESIQEDIISKNKTGYFVVDERELIDKRNDEVNQAEAALDILQESNYENRLALTTVGYYLLENPVEREGSRNDKLHAYAEPLVGLISFKPVRDFSLEKEIPTWEVVKEDNIIVAIN